MTFIAMAERIERVMRYCYPIDVRDEDCPPEARRAAMLYEMYKQAHQGIEMSRTLAVRDVLAEMLAEMLEPPRLLPDDDILT